MKSSMLLWLQTGILFTNLVELFFVIIYFLSDATTFPNDFYRYVEVFQFSIGTLCGIVVAAPHLQNITHPHFIDELCQVVPFLTHTAYHLIAYVVVLNVVDLYRHTAITFMIGISLHSINVMITYMAKS